MSCLRLAPTPGVHFRFFADLAVQWRWQKQDLGISLLLESNKRSNRLGLFASS